MPEENNKDGDESNDVDEDIEPWVDVFDFIG